MLQIVLDVIFPIFGILAAGYLVGRLGLMNAGTGEVLNRFVFLVALPALIVSSLSRLDPATFFDWAFIGTLSGGMAVTFLLGIAVSRRFFPDSLTAAALNGLTSMFSSTGYIGLPLVLLAYSEAAFAPGLFGAVVTGAVFLPTAMLIAEIDRSGHGREAVLKALGRAVGNPLLLSTALGLLLSGLDLTLPGPLDTFFDLLAGAYVPCALFAAGFFFVGCQVRGDRLEVGWLLAAKLALHPLFAWLLGRFVFGLEGELLSLAVVFSALPSGAPVLVLAQRYGQYVERSTAAIVLSTALSVVSVSLLLTFL